MRDDGIRRGFLVARTVAADECEILNLAVAPDFRRQGWRARSLEPLCKAFHGGIFLEVRESNEVARVFYKSLGFKEISIRHRVLRITPRNRLLS